MTALWIAVAVLVVLWIAAVAAGFLLLAMGRLNLDLGWGRSIHPLGPIEIRIDAPRELVFEMIQSPYTGRTPRDSGIEVLAKSELLVVAAHLTKLHFYTARTVEAVEFQPPSEIGFRHLTGPVPYAVERFALGDAAAGTKLVYTGEIGIDYFVLGRIAGRRWAVPQWERTVRKHLDDLKQRAEQRAAARQRRAGSP
jgi:hypothetical protein